MNEMIVEAKVLAFNAFKSITRPNKSKEPKIIHLAEVAQLAGIVDTRPEVIAAAWLHDIIEDTEITYEELKNHFGIQIADMVHDLSDPPEWAEMHLGTRKQKQVDRIKHKAPPIRLIKIADQISNMQSVLNDPPVDWPAGKSLQYIQGAYNVAEACSVKSMFLEQAAKKLLAAGSIKYRI